jgi:hypothetical protein
MSSSSPIIPNYLSRGVETPPPLAIFPARVALWCGIIPCVVGTFAFTGWLASGYTFLAMLGLFAILLGLGGAVLGFPCLLTHYVRTAARRPAGQRGRWKPLRIHRLALLLLVGNFPLAFGYFQIATYVDKFYRVTIRNEMNTPVDRMTVDFGSRRLQIHDLEPGDSASYYVNLRESGWPEYDLTRSGTTTHGTLATPFYNKYSNLNYRSDQVILIQAKGVWMQSTENSRQHLP